MKIKEIFKKAFSKELLIRIILILGIIWLLQHIIKLPPSPKGF